MANPQVLNTNMTDEEILAALAHYLAANNPHNVTAEQVSVSAEGITADNVSAALLEVLAVTKIQTLSKGTAIPEGADLDTYTTPGVFHSPTGARSATLVNSPTKAYGFRLEVREIISGRYMQIVYPNAGGVFYIRNFLSAGWSNWFKFAGEEIIPAEEAAVE